MRSRCSLTTRYDVARQMAALGEHARAEAEFGDVLATELRVLGADHPDTLATRRQIALEMAARGDQVEGNQEAR